MLYLSMARVIVDSEIKKAFVNAISIIVPSRDRMLECEALFRSLKEANDNPDVRSEVIVVDDSVTENSKCIKEMCDTYGFRYIPTKNHNISAKRNLGWNAANYEIVLFIDSDCIADKDLLIRHLESYQHSRVAGCLGDLIFEGSRSLFFRATEHTPFAWPFRFANRFKETTWGPTANISFKKVNLERIGGFDTTFPDRPGGEDVDIGLRVTDGNYRIICNPNAKVRHSTTTWNTFWDNAKRFFGWGRADYHLIVRHKRKTSIDLPRIPLIFSLLLFLSWIIASTKGAYFILTLPFLWLGLTVGFSVLLFHSNSASPSLGERFIALVYILINESGTLYEGIKNHYWPIVIKRMIYGPDQIYGEWHEAGSRLWAQWIAMAICFVLY